MPERCRRKWDADVREMHTAEGCTCEENAHASGMQMPEGCTHRTHSHSWKIQSLVGRKGFFLFILIRNTRQKFQGTPPYPGGWAPRDARGGEGQGMNSSCEPAWADGKAGGVRPEAFGQRDPSGCCLGARDSGILQMALEERSG